MGITSAIVLFAVVWFMVFFIVLPLRLTTQADVNDVVPGTPRGAPVDPQLKKRVVITSGVAVVVWLALVVTITSGVISVRDLDWFDRMGPEAPSDTPASPDPAARGLRARFSRATR